MAGWAEAFVTTMRASDVWEPEQEGCPVDVTEKLQAKVEKVVDKLEVSTRMRVKNTFIDFVDDEDNEFQAQRREFRTCPEFGGTAIVEAEPDAEFSPVRRPDSGAKEFYLPAQECHDSQGLFQDPYISPDFPTPVKRRGSRGGVRRNRNRKQQLALAECVAQCGYPHSGVPDGAVAANDGSRWTQESDLRPQFQLDHFHGSRGFDGNSHGYQSGVNSIRKPRQMNSRSANVWCHIYINPGMLVEGFDVTKKIIGRAGCNTRSIFDATGAKIRLRGQGSGHLEDGHSEAPAPLMLTITGEMSQPDNFCEAISHAAKLLSDVSRRFEAFVRVRPRGNNSSAQQLLGGELPFWVGEVSANGRTVARETFERLQLPFPFTNQPLLITALRTHANSYMDGANA